MRRRIRALAAIRRFLLWRRAGVSVRRVSAGRHGDLGVYELHHGVTTVRAQPSGLVDAGREEGGVDDLVQEPPQECLFHVVAGAVLLYVEEEEGAVHGIGHVQHDGGAGRVSEDR